MKENPLTTMDSVEATRILEKFNDWVVSNPPQKSSIDQLRSFLIDSREALLAAPLAVLEYPAQELQTQAQQVDLFDSELHNLVEKMCQTMVTYRGIGLAANQVGILKRVLVLAVDGDYSNLKEFINPEIIDQEGRITWQEGCLSFPTYFEFIDRAKRVKVKAQDRYGTWFEFECEGLTAVCLQHEIDHLNGKTFLERMTRIKKQSALKRLNKRKNSDKRR